MSIIIENKINIIQTLKSHQSDVLTCDFAPNFTLITGSSDKTVRIWDWIPGFGYTERVNSPLKYHKYQVTCVKTSPQGSLMASASVDGTAILWGLISLTKLYTMTQVNGDAIRVCRFSPDSSILVTAGDNGAICVWDLVHKSLIRTIFEHEGSTQSLAFTPDSQYLVSACSLEVIRVWYVEEVIDTTSDSVCSTIGQINNAHDLGVFSIDISKIIKTDEENPFIKYYRMATSGNNNEIKIWILTSKSYPKNKSDQINQIKIELYDIYNGHNSSVTCITFNNNGSYLISSSLDKFIKIWDQKGNCIATLKGHDKYINCVSISRNSTLIASGSTGSYNKMLFIWDLTGSITTDTVLIKPHHHHHRLSSSSSSSNTIAELQLMRNAELNSDNEVKMLEKIDDVADGAINCCTFNQNGLLATASGDKLVKLFYFCDENQSLEELNCSPLEGHTYSVNCVNFNSDGTLLASCSLDGCTNIWSTLTGEKLFSLSPNSLSIKTCRFSCKSNLLVNGGDDDKATIWDISTKQQITVLEGHLDAVTSAVFSPNDCILITTSFNGDFRIWHCFNNYKLIHLEEYAHYYGIQNCDISPNMEPIPNNKIFDEQTYLLATCGNDELAKLWSITIINNNYNKLNVKLWKTLNGHGGNVICIRFSPIFGELLCSTATNRQARIWSVYSSECLYVLDHDSIVTSCTFKFDCSILIIGCLDKTLWIWKLPQQLVFQSVVASKIKCRSKALVEWNNKDVINWLKLIEMEEISENVKNSSLNGEKILIYSENEICSGLDLNENQTEKLIKELRWLKKDNMNNIDINNDDIPYEYLCPITQEIMHEPVTCSDGFTYERKAITEWFMSGKATSPLTNQLLTNTEYTFNQKLRNAIHDFLDKH